MVPMISVPELSSVEPSSSSLITMVNVLDIAFFTVLIIHIIASNSVASADQEPDAEDDLSHLDDAEEELDHLDKDAEDDLDHLDEDLEYFYNYEAIAEMEKLSQQQNSSNSNNVTDLAEAFFNNFSEEEYAYYYDYEEAAEDYTEKAEDPDYDDILIDVGDSPAVMSPYASIARVEVLSPAAARSWTSVVVAGVILLIVFIIIITIIIIILIKRRRTRQDLETSGESVTTDIESSASGGGEDILVV